MRPLTAGLLFAAAALTVAAQDKTDKYVSEKGKFSVVFPGGSKPAIQNPTASGLQLHIAIVEKAGGGFAVIYSDLPPETRQLTKAKELLDGGQKGLETNFKAKVVGTPKDTKIGGHEAREIQAEKDGLNMKIQIILAGDRLYQVFAVGSKELIAGKDTEDFFKSFEINAK